MEKNNKEKNKVQKKEVLHKKKIEEDLSLTKQQRFNFETNELEYEEKKENKRVTKKKIVVVEKKVYPKLLITTLIVLLLCLILFNIYHFITFDHNKVKIKKVVVTKKLDNNYLFLGDSITDFYDLEKYYKDMPVVNSGIGGNQTTDILNNMQDRVYKYNPTKVFLLIGTNDISEGSTNDEIVKNIRDIIKNIQKKRPNCEIYLESIYPINDSDDSKIYHDCVSIRTNETIKKINSKLKKLSKELDVTYIDMYSKLVDENGNLKLEYTKEGLHLTDEGYKVVTENIMKYIEE